MAPDSAQNLIVLSDGTGNSASKQNKTNVWRLYQAIDLSDGTQIAEFGDGVGTSGARILRVLGLALGVGVKRNVLTLYKFLCRNYKKDDRIWAFGFSRGAFTIRLLVRLIEYEGLVSFESEAELNRNALAAYRAYRKKAFATYIPWVFAGRVLRDSLISARNAMWGVRSYPEVEKETVNVYFVGVWDTVAAYGLPIAELTQAVDKWVWPMNYRGKKGGLSTIVRHARHALSLDDERSTFHPILWDETAEQSLVRKELVKSGRLQQVWFAGAHADVGGGYPDAGLSFVPLVWMIGEAERKGLRFGRSVVEGYAANATATGRIYDSRAGFFAALWRYQPRDVYLLMNPPRAAPLPLDDAPLPLDDAPLPSDDAPLPSDKDDITPVVHGSVMIRMACGNGYAPISLPQKIDVLVPDGPPVAFNNEAVEQALAQGIEKQRRILEDTEQLLTSAQAKTTELAEAGDQALAKGNEKQRRILKDTEQLLLKDTEQVLPAASAQTKTTEPEPIELVWDTVWWRRIVYFVSVAFVVVAVAFPLLAQYLRIKGVTDPVNESAGGLFHWIVDVIGGYVRWIRDLIEGFLPWFTKPWVAAIDRYPAQAVFVVIGLFTSLWCSRVLQRTINDRARVAWNVPVRGQDRAKSVGPPKPGWRCLLNVARNARTFARLNATTKGPLGRGYRFFAQTLLPALFLGLSGILVMSLGHSAVFGVGNTIGAFCTSTNELKDASTEVEILGAGRTFETRSMCHATGLRLIAGGKYRIRLDMDEGVNGEWFDQGIPADVTGFTAESMRHYAGSTGWRYYLGSPLKRWWRENWFQPIARIGEGWWEAIKSIPRPATAEFKKVWLERERDESYAEDWVTRSIRRRGEPAFR